MIAALCHLAAIWICACRCVLLVELSDGQPQRIVGLHRATIHQVTRHRTDKRASSLKVGLYAVAFICLAVSTHDRIPHHTLADGTQERLRNVSIFHLSSSHDQLQLIHQH